MNIIKNLSRHERFEIIREIALSIIISALVTFLFNLYKDTKQDQRVASREFISNFSRVFFDTDKYRNISRALEENYLYNEKFQQVSNSSFQIGRNEFSEYDLDDYLGLIADISSFYDDGFITKELLERQYKYHICIATNSEVVLQYRQKLSGETFSDDLAYSFLDGLAKKIDVKGKNCREL